MSTSTNPRPVLILGASARIAVPIARLLRGRCGVPVEVASLSRQDQRISSRAVRDFVRLPDFSTAPRAFSERLLALIRERQFDMLIPVQDLALAAMAENYDALSALLHVASPGPQAIRSVLTKSITLQAAQTCGIRVPRTSLISASAEIESAIPADLPFPAVVKPAERNGSEKFKVLYFASRDLLSAWLKRNRHGDLLLQEYCAGAGIGIEMLIHRGKCLASFQHRRLKEDPPTGGVAVMAVSERPDAEASAAALRLLQALDWEGVAMVEFRRDPSTGAFTLLEINGRYWGSCSFPFAAGVEFPVYEWQLAHGQVPSPPQTYREGLRWRWTSGYLSRLHSVMLSTAAEALPPPEYSKFQELARIPLDFAPRTGDALFRFSDPLPALREIVHDAGQTLVSDLRGIARALVPPRWHRARKTYARLGPAERRIYARANVLDTLGFRTPGVEPPPSARSFLFVCFGNIMRSAMAEAAFRKRLLESGHAREIAVASAGLHANPGRDAHPWAQAACHKAGLSLAEHKSQPVTAKLIDDADVVFAMDFQNQAELLARYPSARRKIFMMSVYADPPMCGREIADPYYGDENSTEQCLALLHACIDKLLRRLFAETADLPLVPARPGSTSLKKGIENA